MCTTDGAESNDLLVEQVRKRTWHKTVVSNNTISTIEAILFHSQRSTYVLAKIGKSCEGVHEELNPEDSAWMIKEVANNSGIIELIPIWDTAENIAATDVRRQSILQKCGCKKTHCNPLKKQCACVKKGDHCSILCKCTGCLNTGEKGNQRILDDSDEEDLPSSPSSSSSDSEESDWTFYENDIDDNSYDSV